MPEELQEEDKGLKGVILISYRVKNLPMELLCISDLHGRLETMDKIKREGSRADLLIVAGDITNFGKRKTAELVLKELLEVNQNLLAVPGNCDTPEVNDVLEELGLSLHAKGRVIGGTGFFGVGGSNATPFNTPQEYRDERLSEMLGKGYEEIKNQSTRVLVSHAPPFNTKIDATHLGMHVGSRAVRAFLEEKAIDLVVCGHVHEARGSDSLGGAMIINPGPAHMGFAKVKLGKSIEVEFIDLH